MSSPPNDSAAKDSAAKHSATKSGTDGPAKNTDKSTKPGATTDKNPKTTDKSEKSKSSKSDKSQKPESETYVVKKGDNLFDIAAWFNEHGYHHLYELNKSVIGSDPNLIFPGQRITISDTGTMTLSH